MASLDKGATFASKFTVLDCIGIGGMCEVYLAQQPSLERTVAIKILREELSQSPLERERFLREARHCSKLQHVNITTIYETGEENDVPYIAMEYVEGNTLEFLLQEGLKEEWAIKIVLQVARALDYAHHMGIVHRDLKPANILVDNLGEVKVADWGLSKREKDKSKLTKTGMVMGTPQYMAPEQIISSETTKASDLYALGVIIFECFAGHIPFSAKDTVSILRAHLDEKPPELRKVCPSCPHSISNLVRDLLAKEPENRPRSAEEVIECFATTNPEAELRKSNAATEMVRVHRKRPKKPKKKETKRRAIPVILLSILFILFIIVLSWSTKNGKAKSEPTNKVEVLSVKANRLNNLTIRFKGYHQGTIDLEVHRKTGGKANVSHHVLTLHEARSISRETSLIDFRIIPFPESPYEVTVSSAFNKISQKISPENEIKDVLGPLRALHKKEMEELVNDVRGGNAIMARARIAKSDDGIKRGRLQLKKALERAGLTKDYVNKVRQLVEGQTYLKSAISKELAPILIVESLISYHNENEVPWTSVFEAMGGSYEELQLSSGKEIPFPHHRVLERITFGDEGKSRLFISCLTGQSRKLIYQVYNMGKRTYGHVLGVIPPLDKMKPFKEVTFSLDESIPINEKGLFLAIVVRYVSTEVPLHFTINKSKPYVLYGNHDIRFDKPGENKLGRFIVPIDTKDLKKGQNKITLFVKPLNPNLNLLALKEFMGPPVVIIDELAFVQSAQ